MSHSGAPYGKKFNFLNLYVYYVFGMTVDNKTIWQNMNGQMAGVCVCVCVEMFRMLLTSADANVKNEYLTVFESLLLLFYIKITMFGSDKHNFRLCILRPRFLIIFVSFAKSKYVHMT